MFVNTIPALVWEQLVMNHCCSLNTASVDFICVCCSRSHWLFRSINQLCKHVVAKVTLVPCSVNLTGKGHFGSMLC